MCLEVQTRPVEEQTSGIYDTCLAEFTMLLAGVWVQLKNGGLKLPQNYPRFELLPSLDFTARPRLCFLFFCFLFPALLLCNTAFFIRPASHLLFFKLVTALHRIDAPEGISKSHEAQCKDSTTCYATRHRQNTMSR